MDKKQYVTVWLNYVEYQANDVIRTSVDVEIDGTKLYGADGWIEN